MLNGFIQKSRSSALTDSDLFLVARSGREHRIGVVSLQILLDYAAECGVHRRRLLDAARLPAGVLEDPGASVAPEAELSAMAVLARELGAPFASGFELGLRYHLPALGALGLGLMSCANVGEAVEWGLRYAATAFSFIPYRFSNGSAGPVIRMTLDHLPPQLRAFLVGRDLGAMQVVHRALLPEEPIAITGIQLTLPRFAGMDRVEDLFGCPIETGHSQPQLCLGSAVLNTAMSQANRITALQCEVQCEQLLEERALSTDVVSRVRRELLQAEMPLPSIHQMAGALRLSERSLRRKLADEQVHWRELVDERLEILARRMLGTGRHTVQEVGMALGYAETASFSRAFKRWTGVSPKEFVQLERHAVRCNASVPTP